jgi:hypothetical protein
MEYKVTAELKHIKRCSHNFLFLPLNLSNYDWSHLTQKFNASHFHTTHDTMTRSTLPPSQVSENHICHDPMSVHSAMSFDGHPTGLIMIGASGSCYKRDTLEPDGTVPFESLLDYGTASAGERAVRAGEDVSMIRAKHMRIHVDNSLKSLDSPTFKKLQYNDDSAKRKLVARIRESMLRQAETEEPPLPKARTDRDSQVYLATLPTALPNASLKLDSDWTDGADPRGSAAYLIWKNKNRHEEGVTDVMIELPSAARFVGPVASRDQRGTVHTGGPGWVSRVLKDLEITKKAIGDQIQMLVENEGSVTEDEAVKTIESIVDTALDLRTTYQTLPSELVPQSSNNAPNTLLSPEWSMNPVGGKPGPGILARRRL